MIHNYTEMNRVTKFVPKLKPNTERLSHINVPKLQNIRVYRCLCVVTNNRWHNG